MLFFDIIMALVAIGCSVFVFIVLIKLWQVLGILERVLSTFFLITANYGVLLIKFRKILMKIKGISVRLVIEASGNFLDFRRKLKYNINVSR